MHSPYAYPLMSFFNEYYDNKTYYYLLADDEITRLFLPSRIFIEYSKKQGVMPPHHFTKIIDKHVNRVLILSVREFKPTYWDLRLLTWRNINILELYDQAKKVIENESSILYQDTLKPCILILASRE